ncbi:hypothetical protein ABZ863_30445 [Saccharomonospora sp. NPDC046836]|uniref:hypothetical protein n=1 Tax=Saccharomonospora sp. NPDC046836 TaxID=3156921 RepID=UPI00340E38EE
MLTGLLTWLAATDLSVAMRGTRLLYPVLECVHLIGIAVLVGPALAFDMRLLGVGHRLLSVDVAAKYLLSLSRIGFILAVTTGFALLVANPWAAASSAAPFKFGLLAIAGVNIAIFHAGIYRRVGSWSHSPRTPVSAKVAGAISTVSWAGVIVSGRMLAYA